MCQNWKFIKFLFQIPTLGKDQKCPRNTKLKSLTSCNKKMKIKIFHSQLGEDEGEYNCSESQEGSGGGLSRTDGTPILSVDSALESWDSCGLDGNTMPVVPGKPPLPPKSRVGNRGNSVLE